jgi:GNAT superfamily N-acetyltransferase
MIRIAASDAEIAGCYAVLSELRPRLSSNTFISTIRRLMENNQFELAFLDDGGVKAVAGFRVGEWLHSGRYLEIEDLVTSSADRSRGYGGQLFDWLARLGTSRGCRQLRLVSGVKRTDAHRFYVRKRMTFEAQYFSMNLGH